MKIYNSKLSDAELSGNFDS